MILKNLPDKSGDAHVFECSGCGVVYMTADHIPPNGREITSADER
jgi:hypothetical protein